MNQKHKDEVSLKLQIVANTKREKSKTVLDFSEPKISKILFWKFGVWGCMNVV